LKRREPGTIGCSKTWSTGKKSNWVEQSCREGENYVGRNTFRPQNVKKRKKRESGDLKKDQDHVLVPRGGEVKSRVRERGRGGVLGRYSVQQSLTRKVQTSEKIGKESKKRSWQEGFDQGRPRTLKE